MIITADTVWRGLLSEIYYLGAVQTCRGFVTKELVNVSSSIDMKYPIVTAICRGLSYDFMMREASWILSGSDKVEPVAEFAPSIRQYSDNGITFFGAYGPKIVEQLPYVILALLHDDGTRQAVINIWRESPPQSKDIPCTLSVQWIIRDGLIHCIDTMRSSDIWLGWPYDIFNFSMITAFIALCLRPKFPHLRLGLLRLNACSQHLYQRNFEGAKKCLFFREHRHMNPFNLDDWTDGETLRNELLRGRETTHKWLRQLVVNNGSMGE